MDEKAQINATNSKMRQVLLEEWDPIGIADHPGAQDEYDAYLGELHPLLAMGTSDTAIANHLRDIEINLMGLRGQAETQLISVAQSLRRAFLK